MKTELTYERANELMRYDAETGKLYWRVNRGKRGISGNEAGGVAVISGIKYRLVGIDGARYLAHRIAWLLYYGEWPKHDIDHIDGDGLNNRPGNMRDVSHSINMRNQRMRSDNTSGVTGVYWDEPARKWRARVKTAGIVRYLGRFTDLADAELAVRKFRERHGFTDRHGEAI
jgi:hypothetical protein